MSPTATKLVMEQRPLIAIGSPLALVPNVMLILSFNSTIVSPVVVCFTPRQTDKGLLPFSPHL